MCYIYDMGKKKTVTFYVDIEQYKTLKEFLDAIDVSISTFINDFISVGVSCIPETDMDKRSKVLVYKSFIDCLKKKIVDRF